jgi:hypothetical protein
MGEHIGSEDVAKMEPTDLPVGGLKKEAVPTFKTASNMEEAI